MAVLAHLDKIEQLHGTLASHSVGIIIRFRKPADRDESFPDYDCPL
jgi:hypothetical protein